MTLVPYGCTKFRVSMLPVTKWTFETVEPAKESDGWGPERDGLRTRLLPAQRPFFIGRPAKFRLEMKNFGKHARLYDDQQVQVNDPVRITDLDGKRVRYVGGSCQTIGNAKSIAPGEKVVLFDGLDLDGQYLFAKPGSYALRFGGQPGRPRFETTKE